MKIKLTPLLFIILSVLAFALFIRLWVGAGSFPEIWALEEQIAVQSEANTRQQQLNEQLEAELKELSDDNAAIEAHARDELGMVKEKETFYQIILQEDKEEQLILVDPETDNNKAPYVE